MFSEPPNNSADPFLDEQKTLSLLFNNTQEYFILVDKELRIRTYNKITYQHLKEKMNLELFNGMSVLELTDPERRPLLSQIYNDVLNGATRETEVTFNINNGEQRQLHNTICPARDESGTIVAIMVYARDITEQKQSEEKYRLFFYKNPLPMWTFEIDTLRFLDVNDAAINHYGYSREEFLSMTLKDIRTEEDSAEIDAIHQKHKDSENVTHENVKHRKKNGEIIHVNISRYFFNEQGKKSFLVLAQDVTEKLRAEKALGRSNERFQLVSKATSDAIFDLHLKTETLYWGEGMATLFGYNPKEVTMERWQSLIHPADRQKVLSILSNSVIHFKKKFIRVEYRFLKSDGTYSYVMGKGFIVRKSGKAVRIIGVVQDFTAPKAKEQQLLESKERYEMVLKATNDLIWDWDLLTNELYRNPEGIQKVYGVTNPEEIEGFNRWLERLHPQDKAHVKDVIDLIFKSPDKNSFEAEYRFLKDNGEYAYIYDRGLLLRDAEGKPLRMIGAAQDVTERKKLEEELLHKELAKQKLIGQATIETQERERGEIGKELHDNVNQILTTTKLYLDLSTTSPELKDELIQKSSKNIIYVINEIRQLSRSLMNPSLGDLGLLDSLSDLIENINITRKLQVTLNADEEIEDLVDESQKLMIFRITQEALNNAVRHSKATEAYIHIMVHNGKVKITIADNGVGFSLEHVKKGAGLKNIENRVYLASGSLLVDSKPQHGCTIKINFPIKINPANHE